MKQVLQDARTGEVAVVEVPSPKLLTGCVLVRIAASLVSAGTERASSEFASRNLLQKARARPDLVRDVIDKVRRDGLFSAAQAVRTRLDQPLALGYSSAGTVIAVGEGVTDIQAGDRVACAGAGYAVHAEIACVPRLLVARIADVNVTFDEAAFTTVGAVALHGIRTSGVRLGDIIAVIGLGLVGQLTVQMLKAAGCRVIGMDIAPQRVELAKHLGADHACDAVPVFEEMCRAYSGGHGVDAVLITAETSSSGPVNLAGKIARERGVVVAVGTVGMDIDRKAYYEKELDFRISRAYGPGRYDAAYEQKGRDYPIGYVRWTEARNMEAFLTLLADGKLNLRSLITHRIPIGQARDAYDLIAGKVRKPFLGVLITYPEEFEENSHLRLVEKASAPWLVGKRSVAIGLLGAGNFAMGTLLPSIKQIDGVELVGVCAANGSHSRHAALKFGFRYCTTDEEKILSDPDVNTVVIATRHHLHATQVLSALQAGKRIFCEKPLCLTESELAEIVRAYQNMAVQPVLMVGFNRRFAPMATRMKAFFAEINEPLAMHYRVNAGSVPPDHWVNDPEQGGGRILGEACHFVDFLSFLADAPLVEVQTRALSRTESAADGAEIWLNFANRSQGTVRYLTNGDRSYSKERLEIFGGETVAVLEDFRRLELVGRGRKQVFHSRFRSDKGHRSEWQAFAAAIRNGEQAPISFPEIVATTLATLRIVDSRSSGQPAVVDVEKFIKASS
jgi:predicted dehydrogenase/threonine dehydrogenase-like Zn-dependent dehydrogenase